jgi:hypothetical protein
VLRAHPEVLDVLVHVDPEDDLEPDLAAIRLPGREALLPMIRPLIADLPAPERIILHYLDGGIEIDLYVSLAAYDDAASLRDAEKRLAERLDELPMVRSVRLNWISAP